MNDHATSRSTLATPVAKHWATPVGRILDQAIQRIDAPHYDMAHTEFLRGRKTKALADLAELTLPNRFERVWAEDAAHGVPYVNATDLLPLFVFGELAPVRYLSRESNVDLAELTIREGWLLMTCSGTIGRTYYVPQRLHEWAATHDLVRIVPHDSAIAGYLFAWCQTDNAQAQLMRQMHGGQITHVTAEQVGDLRVPLDSPAKIAKTSAKVVAALKERESALSKLATAWQQ